MPRKAPSPCNAPGCGALTRGRYCDKHAHMAASWRTSKRADRSITGRPWRRLRAQILERDGHQCQCTECTKLGRVRPATEVDHIVPTAAGGGSGAGNLQAINPGCPARKTQSESRPSQGQGASKV